MKKSTRIIAITATAMIVLGTGLATLAYAVSGGNIGVVWNSSSNSFSPGFMRNLGSLGKLESSVVITETFTDINIAADYGNVQLVPSDHYAVEYAYYPTLSELSVSAVNGKLTIRNTAHRNIWNTFNGRIPFSGNNFDKLDIIVRYPADVTLGSMQVETSLGNVTLSNTKLTGTLHLSVAMGDTELTQVTAGDTTLICDLGNARIDGLTATRLRSNLALGDMVGKNCVIGDIDVELALGDLQLTGDLYGDVSLDCAMGSIQFETTRPRSDFDIELDSNLGEVHIDGEKARGKSFDNDSAPYELEATCDVGDISLRFGR